MEDNSAERWKVYDDNPAGSRISNVWKNDEQTSRVISFEGVGLNNSYIIGSSTENDEAWNNATEKMIQWSMKYNEYFRVFIRVKTTDGKKWLVYTPKNVDSGNLASGNVHHALGANTYDGTWRTFTRDLEADLKEYQPENALVSVLGFLIQGSGEIDDIKMFEKYD